MDLPSPAVDLACTRRSDTDVGGRSNIRVTSALTPPKIGDACQMPRAWPGDGFSAWQAAGRLDRSEEPASLRWSASCGSGRPRSGRSRLVAFADWVPSQRIAVDLKVDLFRNAATTWTVSAFHDIYAVPMAVPYCHVVIPDRVRSSRCWSGDPREA